jgi:hypothetical protein
MSKPTKKQVDAILHVLSVLNDGYRLVDYSNNKFTIEATLDVFTPSFMRLLIDKLGKTSRYDLLIRRDTLKTGLRTQLVISFHSYQPN